MDRTNGINLDSAFIADCALACAARGVREVPALAAQDFAMQATVGYLKGRADGGHVSADSFDAHVEGLISRGFAVKPRLSADSEYAPGSLTGSMNASAFVKPTAPRQLLASLPVAQIDPGQVYVTADYLDLAGLASHVESGADDLPMVHLSRDTMTPVKQVWSWVGVPTSFIDDRRTSFAGNDNAAQKRNAAILALETLLNADLLNGAPGNKGIKTAGISANTTSPLDLTSGSTMADQILTELANNADAIAAASSDALPSPDTLMTSHRVWQSIVARYNFSAGGSGSILSVLQALLAQYGIDRVIIANELKGYYDASNDAMLYFNSTADLSLKHLLGTRPAPVHTFDGPMGTTTVYAASSAGVVIPNTGAAFLRKIKAA